MRQGQIQNPEAWSFFQVDNNDLISTLCIRIAQRRMNQLLLSFLYHIYKHIMKDLNAWQNLCYTE